MKKENTATLKKKKKNQSGSEYGYSVYGGKSYRRALQKTNMIEYEKLRRKNIEDNKRILAELGLANIVRIIKHLFVIRSR